jgi:hypothetical protein
VEGPQRFLKQWRLAEAPRVRHLLEARRRGLPAVALEALCLHNSKSVSLPPEIRPSAVVLAVK